MEFAILLIISSISLGISASINDEDHSTGGGIFYNGDPAELIFTSYDTTPYRRWECIINYTWMERSLIFYENTVPSDIRGSLKFPNIFTDYKENNTSILKIYTSRLIETNCATISCRYGQRKWLKESISVITKEHTKVKRLDDIGDNIYLYITFLYCGIPISHKIIDNENNETVPATIIPMLEPTREFRESYTYFDKKYTNISLCISTDTHEKCIGIKIPPEEIDIPKPRRYIKNTQHLNCNIFTNNNYDNNINGMICRTSTSSGNKRTYDYISQGTGTVI